MKNIMRKMVAGAICMVFFACVLAMPAVASAEKTGADRKAEIVDETGSTPNFGGGDYVFIRFGKDAAFGILWGNKTNPNSIVMLVVHARYLGVADVYDTNGAKMANNYPIRVYSVFGTKILDLFEFNDTNGDGFCNGIRTGDGLSYSDYIAHEPAYKGVSMTTSWTRSDITKGNTGDAKTWEFSLEADNLQYKAVGNSSSIMDDVTNKKMEKVQFTFHLSASLVEVDGVSVPQYKVTVQKRTEGGMERGSAYRNRYEVVSSERIEDLNYSGKRGSYDVKWDHLFEGWDFDPTNVNKSLLLEWHGFAAYYIPVGVQEWLHEQFMNRTGADGQAQYVDSSGTTRQVSRPGSPIEPPRKVGTGKYLDFGGNWTKIGRMKWVSDCTVDGKAGQMFAQVQGARPFAMRGENGDALAGFAVLGGFSYPGGASIYHDPGIEGVVLIDMQQDRSLGGLLLLGGLFVVILVAVAAALYMRGGRKKESFEGSYDRKQKGNGNGEDWSGYYDKK